MLDSINPTWPSIIGNLCLTPNSLRQPLSVRPGSQRASSWRPRSPNEEDVCFELSLCARSNSNHNNGMALTLAFIVNAALRLGFEFGPDVVEQLVQALTGPALRHHGARGRVAVIHGR